MGGVSPPETPLFGRPCPSRAGAPNLYFTAALFAEKTRRADILLRLSPSRTGAPNLYLATVLFAAETRREGISYRCFLWLRLFAAGQIAAGLRGDVFAWIFYGAYVLITVMVWAIGGKATRNVGQGIDKDQVNREAKLTRDLQRKWIWMPRD